MRTLILVATIFVFLLAACNEQIPEILNTDYHVSGKIQKGPYRQGGTISLLELDSQLVSTGSNFSETIKDNFGSYYFEKVSLKSPFVELKADGFYFNEMDGKVSDERLVLTAFANLTDSSVVNINVLTHLSSARIKYLIQKEGKSFSEAKSQSAKETLKAFNLESSASFNPEQLDFANSSEFDSKLLAISTIVQANLNVASLSELLSSFEFDLETDGTIDEKPLQQSLITGAVNSNFDKVSENLSEFFVLENPDAFNQYVNKFITETDFIPVVTKKTYTVSGIVQKGPFRSGTTITLLELDSDLKPTGLNYYSTVTDNLGTFQIPDVQLESDYVELMADGFYYHENFGIVTWERMVLKAISNLSDSTTVNVNIPTNLIADRIKYLIQNEGKTYNVAKQQAQQELLKVFNLDGDINSDYEYIDLVKDGTLNSKLFAISMIVQGYKNVVPLTEFLTQFAQDFKTDGIINSKEIQQQLITSAIFCNVGAIRVNTLNCYNISQIDDFQSYVKQFVKNTVFEPSMTLDLPEETSFGKNLLAMPDNSILSKDQTYCISQNLSIYGIRNQLIITVVETVGSGNVTYTDNDLSYWNYENDYTSYEDGKTYHGIDLWAMILDDYSKTPVLLNFSGTGTIRVCLYVQDEEHLPDNGGSYAMYKYFSW